MIKPVICCIGYNRPDSMRRLLDSVGKAVYDDRDVTLVISIDESPKSDEVEAAAKAFAWDHGEKIIRRYPERLGLKKHCLLCGDLSEEYGAVVFLEDDVVVGPGYYRYVKEAVDRYKDDGRIMGISLYTQKWVSDMERDFIPYHNGYDVFFMQRDVSHGQCWIGERWKKLREWYGEHENSLPAYDKRVPPCVYRWKNKDSWSKYMSFYMAETGSYYVCPYDSFATNLSEVGVHAFRTTDICQVPLSGGTNGDFRFPDVKDGVVYDAIFERKDRFVDSVCGVPFEKICVDVNGMKYDWSGYEYLLSSRELKYEALRSFGANMEPIENNVIYNVPGNAIKLYRIPDGYEPPKSAEEIGSFKPNREITAHLLNKVSAKILADNLLSRVRKKLKRL